uniref:Transcriptional regulator sdnM n=1 Tax=Sordaria araneosa TaxID=573841 RepID=SDNM_SORAA|nr:RecName: Full=Transcriptional regulator sdnM; AltName: Full=Sordarin/hypoxysordarin biosynthesis cluster protein M [Sordaria araneosa]BAV32157.1 LysR family regulatory protein [Sordaria araneosa]
MGLFSAKREPPPVVPTDTITPLRFVDELYPFAFDFSLVFRDVLDPEVLRAAADSVLQRDGWRQLGARLRRDQNSKLEYHLPTHFSKERPLFLFTTDNHTDMSINDHPVLRHVPEPNPDRPTVHQPAAATFRRHMRGPNSPEAFDDWLYNDIPQLAIHIISFSDATIITVTLLHTLTDFLGLMAFYKAWLLTLHGRQDEIAPYIGYLDADPLEGLQQGQAKPPKYVFADREVGRWGYLKFVFRHMWDCYWHPEASLRFFTLPGKFVENLSTSARAELIAAHPERKPEDCFVSDSDVLCAWWTGLMVRNQSPACPPAQSVCLTNRFDSRDVLAKMGLLPSTNISFFGNAAYNASFFAPASAFAGPEKEKLGLLANQVRDSIKLHRTVEQLQAQDAAFRESKARTGHLPLYGEGDMMMCVFTNCYRGRLYQMDFSPALVDKEKSKGKKQALPVFINCTGMESRWSARNATAILGKSENGDWWMSSRLRQDVWERIEAEFERM